MKAFLGTIIVFLFSIGQAFAGCDPLNFSFSPGALKECQDAVKGMALAKEHKRCFSNGRYFKVFNKVSPEAVNHEELFCTLFTHCFSPEGKGALPENLASIGYEQICSGLYMGGQAQKCESRASDGSTASSGSIETCKAFKVGMGKRRDKKTCNQVNLGSHFQNVLCNAIEGAQAQATVVRPSRKLEESRTTGSRPSGHKEQALKADVEASGRFAKELVSTSVLVDLNDTDPFSKDEPSSCARDEEKSAPKLLQHSSKAPALNSEGHLLLTEKDFENSRVPGEEDDVVLFAEEL